MLVATTFLPQGEQAPPAEACIKVTPFLRLNGGAFDHIVKIENACETDRECTVTTDVNPTPITAIIPAGETVEVLTFRASPSRNFRAVVTCDARS